MNQFQHYLGPIHINKHKHESHFLTKEKDIQWPFPDSVYLSEHGWQNLNAT
ncbi:hypothetical protein Nmel_016560 [Mimus melanotis]